jgi:ABC-type oligopeptide transport system substrate-binding subunit
MRRFALAVVALALAACDRGPVPVQLVPVPAPPRDPAAADLQGNPMTEEARKLLAEAGYPGGKDFPRLELLYNTNEAHKKIAATVQEMWRQRLGIEVELRNMEWKVYLEHLTRVDYHIARRGWVADYPDPNTFLDMFQTHSGNNNTKWSSKEYDRLVDEAAREKDPKKRLEVLQKCERILMDELPVVPIYFYVTQTMWRQTTKGLFDNAMNVHPLKDIQHGDGSKPFIMNVGAEVQTLDPNIQRGVPEHRVNLALFEGLTVYHPQTLEAQPGIAESWTVSEDGKTWTFKLRDATWTSGRAVTAHDFVYGWRRQIDPMLASDYAYILYDYLRDAKAYYTGATADLALKDFASIADDKRLESAKELPAQVQARHVPLLEKAIAAEKNDAIRGILQDALKQAPLRKDVSIDDVGVKATDDRTLVVELKASTPFFLYLTSFFAYFPIPKEAVEKHGDRWTKPDNIVSNGPFVMKEWVPNSHILVEKSPSYWDASKVRQNQIRFLPIDNVGTAFNMFRKEQCDFIDTVPLEFVEELKKDPDYHSVPYLTVYFYSFNVTRKPLDDRRVRRALALAINREQIVSKILKGGQTPAYSIVPPGLAGYQSQPFFRK